MRIEDTSLITEEEYNRLRKHIDNLPVGGFLNLNTLGTEVGVKSYLRAEELLKILNKIVQSSEEEKYTRLGKYLFWKNPPQTRFGFGKPRAINIYLEVQDNVAFRSWSAAHFFGLTTQIAAKSLVTTQWRDAQYSHILSSHLDPEWVNFVSNSVDAEYHLFKGGNKVNSLETLTYVNCYEATTFSILSDDSSSGAKNTPHRAMVKLTNNLLEMNKSFNLDEVEDIMSSEEKGNQARFNAVLSDLKK